MNQESSPEAVLLSKTSNAQSRNRTSDTRIFSPLLYQLSYLGILEISFEVNWAEVDSNHRSKLQQIYSLSPLATRESTHIILTSQNDITNTVKNQALFLQKSLRCGGRFPQSFFHPPQDTAFSPHYTVPYLTA